jgi:hypothetical protein
LVPLKAERAAPYGPAGAGPAKKVSLPVLRFVGLKVPDTIWPPVSEAAASSNVSATSETSPPPPTSDISITFCPAGPTTRISMSAGNVWVRLLSVTVARVTVPVRPDTTMGEG